MTTTDTKSPPRVFQSEVRCEMSRILIDRTHALLERSRRLRIILSIQKHKREERRLVRILRGERPRP